MKKKLKFIILFSLLASFASAFPAFAADEVNTSTISAQFDTLLDIVETVVTAIGSLVTLWGIAEWGLAYQSNDGMLQSGAWKKIAGGLIMLLAPTILTLFTS